MYFEFAVLFYITFTLRKNDRNMKKRILFLIAVYFWFFIMFVFIFIIWLFLRSLVFVFEGGLPNNNNRHRR